MPGQSLKDAIAAVEFVHSLGIKVNVNEYTPIPGTKDWRELVDKGLINEKLDPLLLNNTILPLWWSASMSEEEVEEVKQYARKLNSRLE